MLVHLEHTFKKGDKVRMVHTPYEFGFEPTTGIPTGAIPGYANEFAMSLWEKLPENLTLTVRRCTNTGVLFEEWPYAWPSGLFALENVITKLSGFLLCATSPNYKLLADSLEIYPSEQAANDTLEDMIELTQISKEPPLSRELAKATLGFPEVFSIQLESVKP